MSKAKKFGAFSGVFTPSILTILGVIMYMRLGWVVGQAGLLTTIGIIVFAHIISLSTGLSISSIATDKRVKAGGIYYILSRSLGLPMGGAIGITLYVGTALSISLYIIGFAESFLALEQIRDLLGMTGSINDFRLIGTVVIIVLIIIAFISTSLAIKTQFLILTAIFLSLVSIVTGFFTDTIHLPEKPLLLPFKNAESIDYIFSVFFPAVTGFTAGVAMSGDLKDPKKSIPSGTMLSIFVGFVIYIGLAISFAFFVDRDLLINDTGFLLKISWIWQLVIAGIWGATLSSALGGILGGPRILQAISNDKIIPRFLGKGHGTNNEPRNALIFTFLISEAGILIGELNLIASVVSMFYLASYGFINLAYALESWASSDFRPSFKISKIIGIIGFLACFGIMFQINAGTMIIALVLMGVIFFLLIKRQIRNDYGDVWQSVWSSIIRIALSRMDKREIEERNWQPNVILFSGGTNRRPYLIEFGKFLVRKYGMLSNFDLIENSEARVLFPKHKQSITDEHTENTGIFARRQSCSDIYRGIENISATYGFSGIEPNTVLMGWARQTKNPVRFVQMLHTLNELDLNILLLDYDKKRGFGKYKIIDIWWRGAGSNGNLSLMLSKFISASNAWPDAVIRLLVVIADEQEIETMQQRAEQIFESLRIKGEIRFIDNLVEQKSFYDIIRSESVDTDLTFLGIPPVIKPGKEKEFVENTSHLMHDIGSVVLIKASSRFKTVSFATAIELTHIEETKEKQENLAGLEADLLPDILYPKNRRIADSLHELYMKIFTIFNSYRNNCLVKTFDDNQIYISDIENRIQKSFENLQNIKVSKDFNAKSINSLQLAFLSRTRKSVYNIFNNAGSKQADILSEGINPVVTRFDEIVRSIPKYLIESYTLKDLEKEKTDNTSLRSFKHRNRIRIKVKGRPVEYKNKYKKLVKKHLPAKGYKIIIEALSKWGNTDAYFISELRNLINTSRKSFSLLKMYASTGKLTSEHIEKEKIKLSGKIAEMRKIQQKAARSLELFTVNKTVRIINEISEQVKKLNANRCLRKGPKKRRLRKINRRLRQELRGIPDLIHKNHVLLFNSLNIELMFFSFETRLEKTIEETLSSVETEVYSKLFSNLSSFHEYLFIFSSSISNSKHPDFSPDKSWFSYSKDNLSLRITEILDNSYRNIKMSTSRFPDEVEILSSGSMADFSKNQFNSIDVIKISALRLLDYLVQNELIEPVRKIAEKLPERVQEINAKAQDIVRYVSFTLDSEELINSNTDLNTFFENQLNRVQNLIAEVEKLRTENTLRIKNHFNSTAEKLTLHSFNKTASNLKQYSSENETIRRFSFVSNTLYRTGLFANKLISNIIYRQNKAVQLAQNLKAGHNNEHSIVNKMLDVVEEISISRKIVQKIPFYYQQLFLRKQNYYSEFWFGREELLNDARKAVMRWRSGYAGAILVIGENNSGKTFLSHYSCSKFLPNSAMFIINPPPAGSVDVFEFEKTLKATTGIEGDMEEIFSSLPENSTFIIDDLELWWERSSIGLSVIQQIVGLINKFGNRHLFVITCGKHFYRIINKINPIDDSFIHVIECEPFNTKELKEAVLFRHRSGGLKFRLNNRKEENFRTLDYAGLFSKHFNCSHGYIGLAMSQWIASIKDFRDNCIDIKAPAIPNLFVFETLSNDIYLVILQFVLHKRHSVEKLQRVMLENKKNIEQQLNYLKRVGIIRESGSGIYELNEFLYIHLVNKLSDKKIL